MISQELAAGNEAMIGATASLLTAAEAQRLAEYLRRCDYQPLYVELGMDPRRLEFARWLFQHGILNEDLERD
jgi:hypothetical protein